MSSDTEIRRVYRPDDRAHQSSFEAVRQLALELWRYRDHTWTVFSQEFRRAVHGSALGVLWNYFLPVLPLTVYLLLARMQVFPGFSDVDPSSFIAFGVTLWFLAAGAIRSPIQTVAGSNRDVMKTALPLSASIVASFALLMFETLVRLAFVGGMFVIAGKAPHIVGLMLPVVLVPMLLFFFGLGLGLAILNVISADVNRVVSVLLTYGIYLSGVIFPIPPGSALAMLNVVNPFAVFIEAAREVVFTGTLANPWVYAVMSVIGVLVFLVCSRVFYVMEHRIRGIV